MNRQILVSRYRILAAIAMQVETCFFLLKNKSKTQILASRHELHVQNKPEKNEKSAQERIPE